ncbi:MAG: LysR substrate-binding domain-containing protein [Sphingobium sp.]
MTLAQLRHLLAIVDAEMNITVAARRLNSTQPGLSRQLRLLEEELGAPLFVRHGKGLRALTELGQGVVGSARSILGEVTAIKALAAATRNTRPLRIATTHTQARLLLPGPLATARRLYPDLAVQLVPSGNREAIEAIETGEADLALVSHVERPTQRAMCLPVYRWDLVGLVPRTSGYDLPEGPTIRHLAALPLVTYDSMLEREVSFTEIFREAGVEPHIAFTARDTDTVKTYVRAGMGIGILAEFAIDTLDSDLRVIDLNGMFPSRITWAVLQRQRIPGLLRDIVASLVPGIDLSRIDRAAEDALVPLRWQDMGFHGDGDAQGGDGQRGDVQEVDGPGQPVLSRTGGD